MKVDHIFRDADGSVLAVLTLVAVALFGTLGLTLGDGPFASSAWSDSTAADAVVMPAGVPNATEIRPDQIWSADESAQGTRPDAAH